MSSINKFAVSTIPEEGRTIAKQYEEVQNGEAWSLDDLKRGSTKYISADEAEAATKTVGRPKIRTVSMTRRPMTATFDRSRATPMSAVFEKPAATAYDGVPVRRAVGPSRSPHRTSQPSSDVSVGAAASAHVSTGRHLHRTRQPSSDASVGAAASAHIGAPMQQTRGKPPALELSPNESFTPLELELMRQLKQLKVENLYLQRRLRDTSLRMRDSHRHRTTVNNFGHSMKSQ